MTKKLEEEFNLPPIEDIEIPLDEPEEELPPTLEEVNAEIEKHQGELAVVDRADAAMPMVTGMDEVEREMDEYANQAMGVFQDLCDLGHNVEDRHAAPIFDSASKMLGAALQAKEAKLNKKMKMLELQQRQAKLELEQKRLEHQIAKAEGTVGGEDNAMSGHVVADRATLLNELMDKMKQNDK